MDLFEKVAVRDNKIQAVKNRIKRFEDEMSSEYFDDDDRGYYLNYIKKSKALILAMTSDVGLYRDGNYVRYELSDEEYKLLNLTIYNEYNNVSHELKDLLSLYAELKDKNIKLEKEIEEFKKNNISESDDLTEDDFNWDDEDFSLDDENSEDDNKVIQFPGTQGNS